MSPRATTAAWIAICLVAIGVGVGALVWNQARPSALEKSAGGLLGSEPKDPSIWPYLGVGAAGGLLAAVVVTLLIVGNRREPEPTA